MFGRKSAFLGTVVLAATLLTSACGVVTTGGAPTTQAPTESAAAGKIALLLPDTAFPRYELHDRPAFEAGVKAACPECEVLYANANGDSAVQQQQAENALTNGAGVIAINPIDVDAAASIAKAAHERGVKIISLGRLIQNAPVDYSASMDSAEMGRLQATALVERMQQLDGVGPVVMINGAAADNVAAAMKAGAKEVFDAAGAEVVAEYDTPEWAPETAQSEMEQAITRLGEDGFKAVYAMNDGMAGGVVVAMQRAGIDPASRPVSGLDADTAALQRIAAGQQYMTVFIDFKDQNQKAAEIAVALIQGKSPDPSLVNGSQNNGAQDVPTYFARIAAITKENIKSELIDSGFTTVDEICTADYADACAEIGLK